MTPPQVVRLAFIVVGLPTIMLGFIFARFLRLRELRLQFDSQMATERREQFAARTLEIGQRMRVLEKVVTDAGAQTAAKINALREPSGRAPGERWTNGRSRLICAFFVTT